MQAKEYQQNVLDRLGRWLEALRAERAEWDRELAEGTDPRRLVPYHQLAWERMAEQGETGRDAAHSPRTDGIGRPVPNATLKIPTGGGKTFLAVRALAMIRRAWPESGRGSLVLWIVPSQAIYDQTLKSLRSREHPLRKSLDVASGNRVKLLHKESPLHRADLESHLCILLLMLPSANRETKETLRLFKSRGSVNGFLPPEDDQAAHAALKAAVPNLDMVEQAELGGSAGIIHSSLGNALRLARPLVILDEGHKGFSDLAHRTLYGFNPSFVLELSATPRDARDGSRRSNWLVNIGGAELEREEMIKLPIVVHVVPGDDWKACLAAAWQKTAELQERADRLRENEDRAIRPILLVQVERTGKDQRDSGHIHAEDAREALIQMGLPAHAVAVKTSDEDELKNLEGGALMDPGCPIRAIITKQALQEGWDCPFAYVLCTLGRSGSRLSVTQLVGRIMRQPGAQKTGDPALDECHVYAFRVETGALVEQVKDGLEKDGMSDMSGRVRAEGPDAPAPIRRVERREPFRGKRYYLPQVLAQEGGGWRAFDYDTDILGRIDWDAISLAAPAGFAPTRESEHRLTAKVFLADQVEFGAEAQALQPFDRCFAAHVLAEEAPSLFTAWRWSGEFLDSLGPEWTPEERSARREMLLQEMVRAVRAEVEAASEAVFDVALASEAISLRLEAELAWSPPELDESQGRSLAGQDGSPIQRSLFEEVPEAALNGFERDVAWFLDRHEAVRWWHRNVVRRGCFLNGWKRGRIYPDLVVLCDSSDGQERWAVLETKGGHLAGNPDTEYKQAVMEKLSAAYNGAARQRVGAMSLEVDRAHYSCAMILQESWRPAVESIVSGSGEGAE